jgi:hypothetical protein
MTLVAVAGGLVFPWTARPSGSSSVMVMNATGNKVALVGRCYIDGRPGSSKTLSAAGGGSITFTSGAITFANGSTTMDLGIQGVATGSGPLVQPDASFVVKRTLVGGTDTITATARNTFAMTGGSGTTNISHGDLIAIVFDMTARAGSDSVVVSSTASADIYPTGAGVGIPTANLNTGGNWNNTASALRIPTALITFDDGTLGMLDGSSPSVINSTEAFATGTNPNERGLLFQVPWDCKVDCLMYQGSVAGATADGTLTLYSDPLGTPTSMTSATMLGEQSDTSIGWHSALLASEVSLTRNTDYCLALLATGAGNITLNIHTLGSASHRAFYTNGTNLRKGTRNGSSGAFSTTTTTLYHMAVRISQLNDSAGGGGVMQNGGLLGGLVG